MQQKLLYAKTTSQTGNPFFTQAKWFSHSTNLYSSSQETQSELGNLLKNSNRERTREGKGVESREPRDQYKIVHWTYTLAREDEAKPTKYKINTLCEKSS